MEKPVEMKTYYAMALDPIHIGTGGYRLGRVDMAIVREPGTNIPKIPGTSISGACRALSAMAYGRYRWIKKDKDQNGNPIEYIGSCAGQGQEDLQIKKLGHCGEKNCPICVTFGFSQKDRSFKGLVHISDAHIILFPVHTMLGTIWITSPYILKTAGIINNIDVDTEKIRLTMKLQTTIKHINVGWLMLEIQKEPIEEEVVNKISSKIDSDTGNIVNRIAIVPDSIFETLVNTNLEVRTSVSIDPFTGTAEDGALYTYEAIPRTTIFWFSVAYRNPQLHIIPSADKSGNLTTRNTPAPTTNQGTSNISNIQEIVEKGLKLFEVLGIGGMNTRGMGRLRIIGV